MKNIRTFVAVLSLVSTGLIQAATPVAIIEDIQSDGSKLSFMDYVNEGQVIELGNKGSVTLGYMDSCKREMITSGTVTIGKQQSSVNKGQLMREEVECSGGQAKLSGQQAGTSGALAFRSAPTTKADITIYGTAPVFRVHTANASITIESIGKSNEKHIIDVKGHHVDLVNKDISLSPGLYKAMTGDKSTIFKIHHRAEPGKGPIISRLIDL